MVVHLKTLYHCYTEHKKRSVFFIFLSLPTHLEAVTHTTAFQGITILSKGYFNDSIQKATHYTAIYFNCLSSLLLIMTFAANESPKFCFSENRILHDSNKKDY